MHGTFSSTTSRDSVVNMRKERNKNRMNITLQRTAATEASFITYIATKELVEATFLLTTAHS